MTLAENLADLQQHRDDFEAGEGFTYTVLNLADSDVIGCVYVYPSGDELHDASVRSWVRMTYAELDVALWRAVSQWLAMDWPFATVAYAPRRATPTSGSGRRCGRGSDRTPTARA